MIPPVIHEQDCQSFKFWFSGKIRDGMFYQNELFYRLQTVAAVHRTRLYQQACQLAQHDNVVVTTSNEKWSMWLSLRSTKLPQFVKPESGEH